ncbi:MAG TPA: redoxin domain-containing protein [Gemmataceae bacterium]|nr:redoxin domain-containing protein [Gemmataceae bacterium]
MSKSYTWMSFLMPVVILGTVGGTAPAWGDDKPVSALAIGAKTTDKNSLRDLHGNRRPLHDFKDHRALVLAFLGTECPISNLYLPGLIELEKKYRTKNVQFIAVYPNEHEDLDQVAMHTRDRDVPFPVLKDFGQRLADTLGMRRVPAVVVLDKEFVLRYRGRIDDRYGVGFRRQKATRNDLIQAIDELLADKKVSVTETEPDGCLLDHASTQPARKDVTYAKDVAPILQQRCQECHRPEQAAPFALMNYNDAVKHARMLKEVTTQRRMPPWHADPRHGKFSNDRRLTSKEIDTLAAWVDAGTPRGDDKDLPKPIAWVKGWKNGKPDLILEMPEAFEVPADGVLPYKHYTIDPGFKEDMWVEKGEARPGVAGVVHHVVVYILKPGQNRPFDNEGNMSILVGWAPGDLGLNCPPDTGLRIPKGSKLMFELHYTPNGTAVKDRSSIGITFLKKAPKYEMFTNSFVNESIRIPPRDPHYRAENTFRFRADALILGLVPHMHWRGKDYFYELIYPDGRKQTLLSVPRWDFNWQNVYQFAKPIKVPKGSRLHAVAHWDNSRNNPYNPDPNKEVRFGLQTWEEMMVGWVVYTWEQPDTAEKLTHEKVHPAEKLFERLDRNGDNVITPDEIPEQLKVYLKLQGIKIPERITAKEFLPVYEELRKRFQKPKAKPPTGDKKKSGS